MDEGEAMAKQIEGVSERIIEAAKLEFLENGYTDASLRTIATAADTSTTLSTSASAIRKDSFPR